MSEKINGLKAALAAVFAALTALWGWLGWLCVMWVVSMGMDYLTGTLAAIKRGEWSSSVAREGLFHKGGCIAVVLIAGMLDLGIGVFLANIPGGEGSVPYPLLVCPLALAWYILTEVGSIIENAGAMGAPYPEWLKRAVRKLRDKVEETGLGGPD